ncbi:MAG: DNA translocase FtsK, partial [Oligoflexia bacterium]|nr:DNA translocase FtsK [Oligoflexia bacterium]
LGDSRPESEPEPEPGAGPQPVSAAKKPRRSGRSAASRHVAVTPGHLVSGGDDDGADLISDPSLAIFELPHLGLLDTHERDIARFDEIELQHLAQTLEGKLADFGVKGEVVAIRPGPVVTTFEFVPAPGIKLSKISGLSDDIAMALKALRVRIVAPIPGKGVVGIEIPNKTRQIVWLRDMLASDAFRKQKGALPMALGKTVEGKPYIGNLASMPHLLVGGTTGSGKSVGVNGMLLSMLYSRTPDELRLILIDPKMLEFELYRDIPHLLHPVVTEPKLASAALRWACTEMDDRYRTLSRWGVRNIASYNKKVAAEREDWSVEKAWRYAPADWPDDEPPPLPSNMPYIVIVIDELADLMMVAAKDVEESIIRLAQKARAAGVHLIVATQRPSVNVITGLIKANMPSRIAFQVRTKVDGRTILDQNGAENLLGKGDQLFLPPGVSDLERLHGPFCSDEEVRRVTDFLRDQGSPTYEAEITADEEDGPELKADDYDELYDVALAYVCRQGKASSSMIQREFKIGYNRAARILEVMEREGVVGPADGARPREILVASHAS